MMRQDSQARYSALICRIAFVIAVSLCAFLLVSCSDESVVKGDGLIVVEGDESALPPCTSDNEGAQAYLKNDGSLRVCSDGKWYGVLNEWNSCHTEELEANSGYKVVCNGDSVGVLMNGDKGVSGKAGVSCTAKQVSPDSIRIACGSDEVYVPLNSGFVPDSSTLVLDSEKVAVLLDTVTGVTQKGPFLSGSKVQVYEIQDGRSLNQSGKTFNGKILDDKGSFKVPAQMVVSQYVSMEAMGYYRNEVSGKVSDSELRMLAITDLTNREVVNINLLTHLEYERVYNLVKTDNMRVKEAKRKAQAEIFNMFGIDNKNFSNSEDLNIVGCSDEDGALLAFSILLQGDRSVSRLSEILTEIAHDISAKGIWNDSKLRDSIVDWAENADATGKLDSIRKNVEGWGLSEMVPNFEKYIRAFWTKEYGLFTCDESTVDTLVAASAKRLADSKDRYVCVDSAKVGYVWSRATELEKDTYGWPAGTDGQIKPGDINTSAKYVYDGVMGHWRGMTEPESYYGVCTEEIEADTSKNVNYNKINKTGDGPYVVCENRQWVPHDTYYAETHFWENPAEEGTIRRGKFTTNVYVYEQNLGFWRVGWLLESDLEMACVSINEGKKIHKQPLYEGDDDAYYTCRYHTDGVKPQYANGIREDDPHYVAVEYSWEKDDYIVASNTFNEACDDEGKMLKGTLDDLYFVCDAGEWRRANPQEELQCRSKNFCQACTKQRAGELRILGDSVYVCKTGYTYWDATYIPPASIPGVCSYLNLHETQFDIEPMGSNTVDWICTEDGWKRATIYDYTWENFQTHLEKHKPSGITYGTLTDDRDGNVYKTIMIDGKEWMAENLRYADSNTTTNMKGNSWCWEDNPANCRIGGRLYSWFAAVDFNQEWGGGASDLIQDQHQGICPHGWHIPSRYEWRSILGTFNGESIYSPVDISRDKKYALMAMGFAMGPYFADWKNAKDSLGFSALPTGYRTVNGEYYVPNQIAGYWTTDIMNGGEAFAYILPYFSVSMGYMEPMTSTRLETNNGGVLFENGFSVRCMKNYTLSGD